MAIRHESTSVIITDIQSFLDYIKGERSLSHHTQAAYQRDLDRYSTWVITNRINHLEPTSKQLLDFVEFLHSEKLKPPSVARHLASLKSFYRDRKSVV